jgi:hypothetical protein
MMPAKPQGEICPTAVHRCDVCEINFNGEKQLSEHLVGKKHTARARPQTQARARAVAQAEPQALAQAQAQAKVEGAERLGALQIPPQSSQQASEGPLGRSSLPVLTSELLSAPVAVGDRPSASSSVNSAPSSVAGSASVAPRDAATEQSDPIPATIGALGEEYATAWLNSAAAEAAWATQAVWINEAAEQEQSHDIECEVTGAGPGRVYIEVKTHWGSGTRAAPSARQMARLRDQSDDYLLLLLTDFSNLYGQPPTPPGIRLYPSVRQRSSGARGPQNRKAPVWVGPSGRASRDATLRTEQRAVFERVSKIFKAQMV